MMVSRYVLQLQFLTLVIRSKAHIGFVDKVLQPRLKEQKSQNKILMVSVFLVLHLVRIVQLG